MERFDWTTFLQNYNAELLRSEHLAESLQYAEDTDLQTAVDAGWLGYPPADETQLTAAEGRLHVALPASYRSFLQTSNGWHLPGVHVPRLWPVDELVWFRDTHQETIEIWSEGILELGTQLEGALRISDEEVGGTAVYLLLPDLVTADGECEAWMFAHWIPGEIRYQSFRELMEEERRSFLHIEGEEAKQMRPGEPLTQLPMKVVTLRDQLREKAQTYRQFAQRDVMGSWTSGQTADGLDEVANRVETLITQSLDPATLLSSLRTLQRDIEAEHRAIHEQWGQHHSALDMLRLVPAARAMSRGEGLRQGAGIIGYFLTDAEQ